MFIARFSTTVKCTRYPLSQVVSVKTSGYVLCTSISIRTTAASNVWIALAQQPDTLPRLLRSSRPLAAQAAILIDRADNTGSRRLESKQDTLKSQEELEAEAPAQTAALFSLVGSVSCVAVREERATSSSRVHLRVYLAVCAKQAGVHQPRISRSMPRSTESTCHHFQGTYLDGWLVCGNITVGSI